MQAVVIKNYGGPEVLQVEERPLPEYSSEEVLIQVKAAGVNRPDVFQRKGKYPAPEGIVQDIPGLEVSGVIIALGEDVVDFEVGDSVMALVPGGGYASHVVAHYGSCLHLPDEIDFSSGAALPETLYTVWHNLFERGQMKAGDSVLIHGGAGGIGSTAIQLAKLFGAKVFTTVSTSEKASFVQRLGSDVIINYKQQDFETELADAKINLILDYIGGEYFSKNMNILEPEGRLIYINAMQGAKVTLNLIQLMQKRIQLSGSTLRSRSLEFKKSLSASIHKNVMPFVKEGKFKVPVYKEFPYTEASKAHELMESGNFLGKIILVF